MNPSIKISHSDLKPLVAPIPASLPRCHVPLRAADAARSNKNISVWNSYLPSACVRTMVRLGWDYST